MRVVPPSGEGIAEAVRALCAGAVVAYPTETVYGLAVDPHSDRALSRLFDIKGRETTKPVLLIVADERQLRRIVARVSPRAAHYMRCFWPGPLTLLFDRAPDLPERITAGGPRVAVRCPGCDTARQLCRAFGGALTSTSANVSGKPPARNVSDCEIPGVEIAIDGGCLPDSAPSTLLDPDTGEVLREGSISRTALVYPGD